jgi:hypothetical protein
MTTRLARSGSRVEGDWQVLCNKNEAGSFKNRGGGEFFALSSITSPCRGQDSPMHMDLLILSVVNSSGKRRHLGKPPRFEDSC